MLAVIPVLSFGGLGGEDVGKLSPVQVVKISPEKEGLRIVTDEGQCGWGRDVASAVEKMKATSSASVFLDTADYLLLEPGTEAWLPKLQQYLRPSCSVCYVSATVDPSEAATYLRFHQPNLTLAQYEAGQRELPTLIYNEGRMTLVQF